MRKFFLILSTIILLTLLASLAGAGYLAGDYFVDYALKRGNSTDPYAPPPAYAATLGMKQGPAAAKPRFAAENWQLLSRDGLKLAATHFEPRQNSNRWVILVHGYGGNQTYMWNLASAYLRRGYQVLTPDLRASGQSEGQYVTLGVLESQDIVQWTSEIIKNDPEAEIVLHGVSMGAATVMLAAAEQLPANVRAIVEDSGYTSATQLAKEQLAKTPNLSVPAQPALLAANVMTRVRTGVFFSAASPVQAVHKATLPTLFIHGQADQLVPFTMLGELFNASAATDKQLLAVEDASHAMGYVVAPREYFRTVFTFLETHLS